MSSPYTTNMSRPAIPNLRDDYPNFSRFVERVVARNPLQAKALRDYLPTRDDTFKRSAEDFARKMLALMEARGIDIDYVVEGYSRMCWDMLKEQARFRKTGKYSCEKQGDALVEVYQSEERMSAYMYGLAVSLFLWPNHYEMYRFFINEIAKLSGVEAYLEVGPGHGLFFIEALKAFPRAVFKAVDISPISIRIADSMCRHFVGRDDPEFVNSDVYDLPVDGTYDLITMCEVLEHLDDPKAILSHLRSMLKPGGHLFITTCANCPAIDHVYLYNSVEHIESEIRDCGLEVLSSVRLPVGDADEAVWDSERVEVNYAAMLRKA